MGWLGSLNQAHAALLLISQVCVAKCNSISSLDAVLCQDLVAAEGPAVETGDSLEVAYTGWLLQNHVLGQVKPCVLQVLSLCVTLSLAYGA